MLRNENYHPRLDPNAVFHGMSEAEYDAWQAEYFAKEGARIEASAAKHNRQSWIDLTAWWHSSGPFWDRHRAKDERTFFETYGREPVRP